VHPVGLDPDALPLWHYGPFRPSLAAQHRQLRQRQLGYRRDYGRRLGLDYYHEQRHCLSHRGRAVPLIGGVVINPDAGGRAVDRPANPIAPRIKAWLADVDNLGVFTIGLINVQSHCQTAEFFLPSGNGCKVFQRQ
jgi:hypothetical protein